MTYRQSKPMAMARWPGAQTVKTPAKESPAPAEVTVTNQAVPAGVSEDGGTATEGNAPTVI